MGIDNKDESSLPVVNKTYERLSISTQKDRYTYSLHTL